MHCVFFFFVKRPRFSDRDRETMKANLLRHFFFFFFICGLGVSVIQIRDSSWGYSFTFDRKQYALVGQTQLEAVSDCLRSTAAASASQPAMCTRKEKIKQNKKKKNAN